MDCPKCGAYNASSSTHCRRCGAELNADSPEEPRDEEWGGSFTPDEDWSEWQPADRQQGREPNPWAWSEPEPEPEPWTSPADTDETASDEPGISSPYDAGEPEAQDIPNYLWPSIAATLCCCAPLGIPAIIFSSRVSTYLKNDDRKGALAASERAKRWLIASIVVAFIFWGILFATSSVEA